MVKCSKAEVRQLDPKENLWDEIREKNLQN